MLISALSPASSSAVAEEPLGYAARLLDAAAFQPRCEAEGNCGHSFHVLREMPSSKCTHLQKFKANFFYCRFYNLTWHQVNRVFHVKQKLTLLIEFILFLICFSPTRPRLASDHDLPSSASQVFGSHGT